MPIYGFECYKEDKGCGLYFEVNCSMDEILGLKPKCPICKKSKPVSRNLQHDGVYVGDSSPTTIGSLAERNSLRMSSDEKNEITKKNRIQKPKFTGTMPRGGSLLPVDSKGKKMISTKKMSPEKAKQLQKKLRKAHND